MTHLADAFALTLVSAIKPYANNSRKHSGKQIDKIAASIAEFGFNAPILIDADGTIVAGHGRYEAALKLGLEQVPTISLGHLSEAKRRAYIIADNRLAEDASWDMTKLASEVQALQAEDLNMLATGLDDVDFTRIDFELRKMAADLEIFDAPPPAPVAAPQAQEPAAVQPTPHAVGEGQPVATAAPAAPEFRAPLPQIPVAAPLVPFNVLLEPAHRDVVIQRLNRIKADQGLPTLGAALFALCASVRGES